MQVLDKADDILELLLDKIDIPESHYEKARDRYHSVSNWLHRDGSEVAFLEPVICPQGSFRYGTVIRPLFAENEYDLDLTCNIQLNKSEVTQEQVKRLIGKEIQAYAKRHGIEKPVCERRRCWRLDYSDEVSFHIDILACIPEETGIVAQLEGMGVDQRHAQTAVAITDKEHPLFRVRTRDWPSSNPAGLGDWFQERCANSLTEAFRREKSIAAVPNYSWKTPLQRIIQILKRHRDTMFKDAPELKPISMIITVLATTVYTYQPSISEGLQCVLDQMAAAIGKTYPRIPNPVNPAEDFADKWRANVELETNFYSWLLQAQQDIGNLTSQRFSESVTKTFDAGFGLKVSKQEVERSLGIREVAPRLLTPVTKIQRSAPKPWSP